MWPRLRSTNIIIGTLPSRILVVSMKNGTRRGDCGLETGRGEGRTDKKKQPNVALLSRYNIYSQIVGTALSVRSHAQAKFYNGVIKFPDCDRSEMAKSVTVAAKLMKSEAIGQNRIPYQWKRILTDSAT